MICSKCKATTDPGQFATYRDKKGVLRRRGICKPCRGKYAVENFDRLQKWRKEYNKKTKSKRQLDGVKRRTEMRRLTDNIKRKTPCADCGKKFPPVAMDFDHIRGKNRSISTLVSRAYKPELILEEIKLCDIVCACCHRVRTAKRKQNIGKRWN